MSYVAVLCEFDEVNFGFVLNTLFFHRFVSSFLFQMCSHLHSVFTSFLISRTMTQALFLAAMHHTSMIVKRFRSR